MSEKPVVLDASALLAVLSGEPGAEAVPSRGLPVVSAVNLLEVSIVLTRRGIPPDRVRGILDALALEVVAFDESMIDRATAIHATSRERGLSLGDAVCLATADALGGVSWTADRAWKALDVGVPIQLIR